MGDRVLAGSLDGACLSRLVVVFLMTALREATFWKKREDRPPEIEKMAQFFSENGWTLWEEWLDPWEDEETGEEHEGLWMYRLIYEQKFGDQLHMWHMYPVDVSVFPEIWEHQLELAKTGWKYYCEEQGL